MNFGLTTRPDLYCFVVKTLGAYPQLLPCFTELITTYETQRCHKIARLETHQEPTTMSQELYKRKPRKKLEYFGCESGLDQF